MRETAIDKYYGYELKKYLKDALMNELQDITRMLADKTHEIIFLTENEKNHFADSLNEINYLTRNPQSIKTAGLIFDGNSDYLTLITWNDEQWKNFCRISSIIE